MTDTLDPDTFHRIEHGELITYDAITGEVIPDLPVVSVKYTPRIGRAVCDLLRDGMTLTKLSNTLGIPKGAIHYWKVRYPDFAEAYVQAKKDRAESFHDKVLDCADEALDTPKELVPGLKLKAELYKWAAEKGNATEYGNKNVGQESTPLQIIIDTGIRRLEDDAIKVFDHGDVMVTEKKK